MKKCYLNFSKFYTYFLTNYFLIGKNNSGQKRLLSRKGGGGLLKSKRSFRGLRGGYDGNEQKRKKGSGLKSLKNGRTYFLNDPKL